MINKENMTYAGLGAGSVVLPQIIARGFPNLLTNLAPLAQNTLPYCTGVCGACGGACFSSLGIVAALGIAVKYKQSKE